ncbi:zinc metalloprotease [Luteipulveratus sp. YIM 133132]|uniref:zinc metalloprotease n=1 Tax=Luteipulveratus flavus TaxID=3031728 RepID=UPI0023B1D178|nr:zinc metalloprotease [Luteipulveratus sp. YIM 133132]MDE9367136.1 zinc metalloprotease [Luteipulveratus sp. YIM 133132]
MTARRVLGVCGAMTATVLLGVAPSVASSHATGVAPGATASSAVAACGPSAARVVKGSTVKEPELYSKNEANKYGVIKPHPLMASGSVNVPTIFHVVSDHALSPAENTRMNTMISAQMRVMNDSYAGRTASTAANTPFRFSLVKTTHTVNPTWSTVVPGKNERDMKKALYEGDARTLNVYVANIGGGLLGWAYFPKGYNNGRDYLDGVVMLDESMPGGVNPDTGQPWKYGLGDTLVHEVGHWMMLEHAFQGGCSASGDGVSDTPREAHPQFDCPVGADTCTAPGLDPIHNFMDYTQDSCMDMFTPGQSKRMSDAYIDFRDPTAGR